MGQPTAHRWRPAVADLVVAGAATALAIVGSLGAQRRLVPPMRPLDALGWLLVVAGCVALAWRRSHPTAVLAATITVVVAYLVGFYPYGPVLFTAGVAMYSVAARVGTRRAVVAVGVAFGTVAVTNAVVEWPLNLGDSLAFALGWALCLVTPLLLGVIARLRRDYAERSRRREADLARLRVDEEVARERLRLVREVHDVVAHGLSVISVQSGAALHVFDDQPAHARAALTAIRAASAEALRDLRGTLDGALDGVDRLPALVSRLAHSGLSVDLRVDGAPVALPPATDHAAYRIVQESLTNVARHAGAAAATIVLTYEPGGLRLAVTDAGRRPPAAATVHNGHGIAGMRDRAGAVGGTLSAGPRAGGGFAVEAFLPGGTG